MADSRAKIIPRLGFGGSAMACVVCNEYHYNHIFLVLCFDTVVHEGGSIATFTTAFLDQKARRPRPRPRLRPMLGTLELAAVFPSLGAEAFLSTSPASILRVSASIEFAQRSSKSSCAFLVGRWRRISLIQSIASALVRLRLLASAALLGSHPYSANNHPSNIVQSLFE